MQSWIDQLRELMTKGEWNGIATLATIDQAHLPLKADARCVVVRGMQHDGTLEITSDARSQKNAQLRTNPSASAVIWSPDQRLQFIVAGNIEILASDSTDPNRVNQWKHLGDSTRAMFTWPACGEPRADDSLFQRSLSADAPIPDTFEVLLLHPEQVDLLDLSTRPHSRILWKQDLQGWSSTRINP